MNKKWDTVKDNGYKPKFFRQNNYTVCLLYGKRGKLVSIGVTKRNPSLDRDRPKLAEKIAHDRALLNMAK